jgi:iron complex outermembrane receptor protein
MLGLAPATVRGQAPQPDPLQRRLTLRLDRIELGAALARLRSIYGVPLAFSPDAVPAGRVVSGFFEEQPVGYILARILEGSGLRVVPIGSGTIVVAPGFAAPAAADLARSPAPDVATGIRELDQIVVMGTPVSGAPERDNPNAVSVVRGSDLKGYHFSRTAELFRTALPGIVLWDQGASGPPAEIAAVRGASSFTARGLKTYIDGIEIASPELVTLLDPRSIERIEVIRGPQGAALYGSDAINGVIQIVTRKGSFGETQKIQGSATAAAGPFDRQEPSSTMLRQDYAGGLTWDGPSASLATSGSLARVGTSATAPFTRNWSAHGAGQFAFGSLLVSGIVRGGQMDFAEDVFGDQPVTPATTAPGASQVDVATLGITAVHQLSGHWVQTLVTGYDRASGALRSRRGIATYRLPLDASHETAARTSVRYSLANSTDFGTTASLTTTAGVEYARLSYSRGSWDANLATRYVELYQDRVRNSGAFLQGKLRAGPFLVNGGARAEWSTSFGAAVGTAWAPSIGASWTRPVGDLTLRVRGGWGKGIRPPEPGMSRAMATSRVWQRANPNLKPETQAGVELGTDLYAGAKGYLRLTYFNQLASDLIQGVVFPAVAGLKPSYQFQNIGAIRNTGIEAEGGIRFGRIGIDGLYYATRSTVVQVEPHYSGYLRLGDQLPEIPRASGSARVSYQAPRLQVAIGASYLGSWTGHDWSELAKVAGEQAPARPSPRDYLIRYPGILKPYLNLSFDFARQFTGYLTIDNLTMSDRFEQHNGNPPAGRSALVGLEVRP